MAMIASAARRAVRERLLGWRMQTGALRCLPDFLIIGAQRSGTSSLYNYLIQNAAVLPALKKEVHYFDDGYAHGLSWYRSHFATKFHRARVERRLGAARIFEASPYYILHPHAPRRIQQVLPDVRLIAVLRNPVDRAESHYHHGVRRGRETLPFEEAINREPERLAGERERLNADETYISFNHRKFSYLTRGRYIEQIPVWMSTFGVGRLLVIRSEDLFTDPATVVANTLDWLGVRGPTLGVFKTFNQASYPRMAPDTRRRLVEYFRPYNQRLYELLGRDMRWDN